MTNRHFYKHRETGIVSAMNDSFAAVFGDLLERVDAPEKGDVVTPAPDNAGANPDNLTASDKESA